MKITNEQRATMLKAHNDLKTMLTCLHECGDLWVSDLSKIESIIHDLHKIFDFVPQENDEGQALHWADWVLNDKK